EVLELDRDGSVASFLRRQDVCRGRDPFDLEAPIGIGHGAGGALEHAREDAGSIERPPRLVEDTACEDDAALELDVDDETGCTFGEAPDARATLETVPE